MNFTAYEQDEQSIFFGLLLPGYINDRQYSVAMNGVAQIQSVGIDSTIYFGTNNESAVLAWKFSNGCAIALRISVHGGGNWYLYGDEMNVIRFDATNLPPAVEKFVTEKLSKR